MEFEVSIAALEDPADPDQILEDVRERLAEQITDAVAQSRDLITESLRDMVSAAVRQQIPPPPPPRPARSPRQRHLSPRHQPYPPRQPTPPERRPLQQFYNPAQEQQFPGWPLPPQPPQHQQIPHPRHPSRRPATAQQVDP
jgi:uncharacterized membrane protein